MSFLHQLKNQASALQTQRSALDEQLEAKSAQVETACATVLSYLQDPARQLSVIEPESAPFSLDGKTPWPPMKQVDFRVDARRKMIRDREVFDYIAMGWRIEPKMGVPVCGVVRCELPDRAAARRVAAGDGPGQARPPRSAPPREGFAAGSALRVRHPDARLGHGAGRPRQGAAALPPPQHQRLRDGDGHRPAQRVDQSALDELAKRIVAQPDRFV
ncbi:hypothetical protein HK414_22780 [Ramlibacter terrae]|uniref:Uncharacterized protein n=1 Tax=Ramlibacter terrae TaxID=2732511 RepID=A0ABX6P7X1_9BURK|nr:hypothetical protein HK414_22780 [Ramlibacter terrae]